MNKKYIINELERALQKINEAEGYLILDQIASGRHMLGDGKAILEDLLEEIEKE